MKKDKKVVRNIVMLESDMKTLKLRADKQDVSVSRLVRLAVREYLARKQD